MNSLDFGSFNVDVLLVILDPCWFVKPEDTVINHSSRLNKRTKGLTV